MSACEKLIPSTMMVSLRSLLSTPIDLAYACRHLKSRLLNMNLNCWQFHKQLVQYDYHANMLSLRHSASLLLLH